MEAHRICSRNRNGDGRSVEAADLTQAVVVTLREAWWIGVVMLEHFVLVSIHLTLHPFAVE